MFTINHAVLDGCIPHRRSVDKRQHFIYMLIDEPKKKGFVPVLQRAQEHVFCKLGLRNLKILVTALYLFFDRRDM